MALEVYKNVGTGHTIRCKSCIVGAAELDGSIEWQDSDDSVYFEGQSIEELKEFIRRHGG